MKYLVFFLIICFLYIASCFFFMTKNEGESKLQTVGDIDKYMNGIKEDAKERDVKIVFYGKTVDSKGEPIAGVELILTYSHSTTIPPWFQGSTRVNIISDSDGFFKIDSKYGSSLYFEDIKKEGYWKGENWRHPSFDYTKGSSREHIPDINKPVQFNLIKEVQDNFLLSWDSVKAPYVKIGETETYYYKLIETFNYKMTDEYSRYKYEMEVYDFKCEASREENKFVIKFKGFEDTDLIYISDNKVLGEEDLSSFKNEVFLEILKDMNVFQVEHSFKYIFIRSRKAKLYSRVAMEVCMDDSSSYLKLKIKTNPYGEINFVSFDVSKLDSHIHRILEVDFRKMLKEGILPKRADLKKYIKGIVVKDEPKPIKVKEVEINEKTNPKNNQISFFGKIVDDKGQPIPDAVVAYTVCYFNNDNKSQIKYAKMRADKNGLFTIEGIWGHSLRIDDSFKFEYFRNRVLKGNLDDFIYTTNYENPYKPNKDKPEIYQLVNELSGNFNYINNLDFPEIIKTNESKDLFYGVLGYLNSDEEKYDLKINIELKDEKYLVSLSCKNPLDSFIVGDAENLANENKNYVKEAKIEFKPEKGSGLYKTYQKFLLMKTSNNRLYAKVCLQLEINEAECIFNMKTSTNLFGDQKFDEMFKVSYTGRIYQYLTKEFAYQLDNDDAMAPPKKEDFIKKFNNQNIKAQFTVPPEVDRKLELEIDRMNDLLSFTVGP
jgi:hypothetical protein